MLREDAPQVCASNHRWFKSFIRGLWGSFEGAAYEEFDLETHVVEPFQIPLEFERFQSMDHGAANPTAWLAWAVDYDGNLIVFDTYYSPGLVSAHAAEIKRRQENGWLRPDTQRGGLEEQLCYADPSIKASHGLTSRRGVPASVWTEYIEHDIDHLVAANNDRAAGYARLLELIHPDPGRPFPNWHSKSGQQGAPRLFVFKTCEQVVAQLQSAPIATDGHDAGEAVDPNWEGAHGHAHAALRYGALSRPAPSPTPEADPIDWRSLELGRLIAERDERVADSAVSPERYVNV